MDIFLYSITPRPLSQLTKLSHTFLSCNTSAYSNVPSCLKKFFFIVDWFKSDPNKFHTLHLMVTSSNFLLSTAVPFLPVYAFDLLRKLGQLSCGMFHVLDSSACFTVLSFNLLFYPSYCLQIEDSYKCLMRFTFNIW